MSNEVQNIGATTGTAVAQQTAFQQQMMSISELKTRASMVHELKSSLMVPSVHYGVIPGCGDKPTLLKNGAELLCMAFRLAPDTKVEVSDLGGGHREYTVTTTLSSCGEFIASGIGSCSTMESKYRYRGTESENTGKPVPREYWDLKKSNPSAANAMIGKGCVARKDENGNWMVFKKGTVRLENPDIADTYNTVLKMASKRSLIDAVLKATGGSCEFTQDLEDMKANESAGGYSRQPQGQQEDAKAAFLRRVDEFIKEKGEKAILDELGRLGFESADQVPASQYRAVYDDLKALSVAKEAK